ncbi:tRNA glutamyl-Q(34) synthetase GluQRS [Marinobacter halodurans]|uniref:Glutamyl-Q tRNA(Asp) synthetase n=1 Tax=Marinobacter halodurans TaxID=2528979 RepID=A0ABY1ZFZ1_9GAMM|nr:tRNA glutamyl-Q(34) synthetase GluQRS [Marinobacter halodurans]TBW49677.1 tRNA glutamyl-Q(34) synthetase GluQRS [Marinobacter halodurans]
MTSKYRGRFAPSPTGPLHFGSLVTGLASYLEARTRTGTWLVRIEDLDPLREPPEAAGQILRSLERHGLHWDEAVRFQSERHDAYAAVIRQLLADDRAYCCTCSRKELSAHGGQHPGDCRNRKAVPEAPHAVRLKLEDCTLSWQDRLLGPQAQVLRAERDDPVLQRKEGFYAYQLAVVVDDIDQGMTDIVRGSDLLETTAAQLKLFDWLGAPAPSYLHIPVILNATGQKLSKQTYAPALDDSRPVENLWQALQALGQQPPEDLLGAAPGAILEWARTHWSAKRLPLQSNLAPASA